MKFVKSLRLKLLLLLLVIGLVPFVTFLTISIKEAENAVKINIEYELKAKNAQLKQSIEKEFEFYRNQIFLWSQHQIMDDIIVDDIDKRITNFLLLVKDKLEADGEIIATNRSGKIIASTEKSLLFKKFPVNSLTSYRFSIINFERPYLVIFSPVYSSFTKKFIGYLIYLIRPNTLKKFHKYEKGHFSFLFNKDLDEFSTKEIDVLKLVNGFSENEDLFLFKDILSEKLFKDEWFLITGVYKSVAYSPIKAIKNSLLFLGMLGVMSIIVLSFFISRMIIDPLEKLTQFAKSVAENKNYSQRININSKDEIQILAEAFNDLMSEINQYIHKLKEESKKRLILFIRLINFFNELTLTESEEQIIKVLRKNIQDFMECDVVLLKSHSNTENYKCYPITFNDFKTGRKINKGSICYSTKKDLTYEEEEFLNSISRLVSLWIERLEMIKQLQQLLEKAQASSKAKSVFIANMSHELRTPLNSIIGFSQILETSYDIPEEYRDLAKSIRVSGEHLLSLINDILDFAKVEANKIRLRYEYFNLKDLLNEIFLIINPLALEKGLKVYFPEDANIKIYTDKKLLKQILINILSNAVKFTDKGYIKLSIEDKGTKIVFHVIDTGIGISKENIDKIFDDFYQIQNPLQKKYKGTGLGLALVKRYVNLLKGSITVKSEGVGKGTEFIITIPKTTF